MDALGSRIKQLRLTAKLSKAALARRVGVSDVTISYWESGTIRQIGHERLVALAEALDCTLTDLLHDTPPPPPQQCILHMQVRQPAPWLHHGTISAPPLDGLPVPELTRDCHLVTPGHGEAFDFLAEGDLAAVLPLSDFSHDGLYLLEHLGKLTIRHLSLTENGDVQISNESAHVETVPTDALPFRLIGQIRARWKLVENKEVHAITPEPAPTG
ncbi:helix-turn-helix domain-containing protein [Halomonas sp. McH1-25]|uniref:helix-turn-helix domain-containing protein n=1 Tax=unclassified Halomonas TaxID=2609666 RepID=UPI001EF47103|nr:MULTISPECIES: helix-turn-helix transcriptional regulator [unclassified Halomonas]MCG7601046.1 helix-turn-helix domain-containing protein [Halomonas sp. McH1-25]MCP1344194.1 helix-turn-helix domain-containing protein [Halomonas sp. FL8]MCP1361210.1 helix-turn-helix domain-containing protein [Halomonas sp. BBD45]MCP1364062.1 helix-turn-helix domain-containing protein [Halomonas sp. BBD48]